MLKRITINSYNGADLYEVEDILQRSYDTVDTFVDEDTGTLEVLAFVGSCDEEIAEFLESFLDVRSYYSYNIEDADEKEIER